MLRFPVYKDANDSRWRAKKGGYCAEFVPYTLDAHTRFVDEQQAAAAQAKVDARNAVLATLVDNFHQGGHATAEGAKECYRQYLLDTMLRLDYENPNQEAKCMQCEEWTRRGAKLLSEIIPLCPTHCTRENVEAALPISPSPQDEELPLEPLVVLPPAPPPAPATPDPEPPPEP